MICVAADTKEILIASLHQKLKLMIHFLKVNLKFEDVPFHSLKIIARLGLVSWFLSVMIFHVRFYAFIINRSKAFIRAGFLQEIITTKLFTQWQQMQHAESS